MYLRKRLLCPIMAEALHARATFVELPASTVLRWVQHSTKDMRRVIVVHKGEQYLISAAAWQAAVPVE